MSEEDIFGELDNRTEEAGGGGDFADWWNPDDSGEELIGVVVEMHSAPQDWTDAGEIPDTIYTVMSVGRGDLEAGEAATPKQHKQLKQGLKSAGLGDLVKLKFTGYQKVDGQPQPMMTYEVGIIPEEEWSELDGADEIEGLLDDYSGTEGDNRRTTPYTDTGGGDGGEEPSGGGVDTDDSELGQAATALKELTEIQDELVDVEQAEKIITEIRGFDVDIEDVALAAGFKVEDGKIRT